MDVFLGTQGAKRQTWSGTSPRSLLLKLHEANPDISDENLAELMLDNVRADDDLLHPILIYWVRLNRRALGAPTPRRRTNKRSNRATIAATTAAIKSRVPMVFLEMMTPAGKKLADCTGKECLRFGGLFAAIGKAVKPTEKVGKVLSERDIAALWRKA